MPDDFDLDAELDDIFAPLDEVFDDLDGIVADLLDATEPTAPADDSEIPF